MQKLSSKVCSHYEFKYYQGEQNGLPAEAHVCLQDHSRFVLPDLARPYRGLHLIRDPRDVLISGAHYHGRSDEAWLHARQARFMGRTCQQAIGGCRSLADAIAFEMRHEGGRTIREMLSWTYSNPLIFEAKYEDLIGDDGMERMAKTFAFLCYPQDALPELVAIARSVSIFHGGADCLGHVRDGSAKQWVQVFDERLKALFIDCFDDALIRLGYEVNHAW
ncbi:hypothetical protein KBY97_05945 [Synechococcus sp. ATX 2A4]|uniref:hypothetical protein n=1 Tax=Synechococcus sp. ATX 2A4 TaxID=2823727 RepID=UPI0020CC486F|nr:hypothetical protein [Synechococcus sp. ATX 2A4]MCP9884667.1 hypothetical protein [Synechococcus sp. ATX 2A4]